MCLFCFIQLGHITFFSSTGRIMDTQVRTFYRSKGSFTVATLVKWYLHRRENIIRCCYRQQWQFEKMGEFLLKSHLSAKSLYPNHVCKRTFSETVSDSEARQSLDCRNSHVTVATVMWLYLPWPLRHSKDHFYFFFVLPPKVAKATTVTCRHRHITRRTSDRLAIVGATTFCRMTLSIMTLNIMAFSIMAINICLCVSLSLALSR